MRRGALAGIVAAGAWAVAEPLAKRAFGTRYSSVRLLGRLVTSGPLWPAAGVAVHLANGAAFGIAFERLGGRSAWHGVAAAQVENVVLWPVMAVMDRIHPDRRNGAWSPLACDARVFAQEAALHALFGAVLGAFVRDRAPRRIA